MAERMATKRNLLQYYIGPPKLNWLINMLQHVNPEWIHQGRELGSHLLIESPWGFRTGATEVEKFVLQLSTRQILKSQMSQMISSSSL